MGQSFSNQECNCLNFIRIIAAFQVMFGHMVEHLALSINEVFFHAIVFFKGVPIFFVISGFLMWFSVGRSTTYGEYLKKRFWRIYPELWVAVVIEIILLLCFYRSWNLKDILLFSFGQGTIFQFWTPDSLRGYGVGTPNGALWTIGVMIQFYAIAYYFYKVMAKRKLVTWIIGLVLAFVTSCVGQYLTHDLMESEIVGKLYGQTFIKYFWLFYFGMFIAEFKDKILPILQKCWCVFVIIAFFFFWTGWDLFSGYYFFWSIFLASGLIGFAYKYSQLSISPDISYGIFLYHMTVVNAFVNLGLMGKWIYVIPIIGITVLFAYISTVTVGKWSLLKKRKLVLY